MTLRSVAISNFRCIEYTEFELDARTTLIVGPNASGKTSLLEALFFLGRGRSFRTRRMANLIRQGQPGFRIVGRIEDGPVEIVAGIQGSADGLEARLAGRPAAGVAELATHLAPQVIDPEIHHLLEEGPARRRRFLDWGVFHVEQSFLNTWQRYQRSLKQRNAALRQALPDTAVEVWDADLVAAGVALTDMRREYVARLRRPLEEVSLALGLRADLELGIGWDPGESLEEAMRKARPRDRRHRATQCGPHRADLVVLVDGVRAKDRVSRGQQKLLAAALTLAQLRLQESDRPGCGALLLDDPAAELDLQNLKRLLAVVAESKSQLVVTALDATNIEALMGPYRMFHVEQGCVQIA